MGTSTILPGRPNCGDIKLTRTSLYFLKTVGTNCSNLVNYVFIDPWNAEVCSELEHIMSWKRWTCQMVHFTVLCTEGAFKGLGAYLDQRCGTMIKSIFVPHNLFWEKTPVSMQLWHMVELKFDFSWKKQWKWPKVKDWRHLIRCYQPFLYLSGKNRPGVFIVTNSSCWKIEMHWKISWPFSRPHH